MIRTFHRQRQDANYFLRGNDSVSRTNYFRIFALASIDILLTLPINAVIIALSVAEEVSSEDFPFYHGWVVDHANWEPVSFSYAEMVSSGSSAVALNYVLLWDVPLLAFVIFGLFGVTREARTSYWRIVRTVCG